MFLSNDKPKRPIFNIFSQRQLVYILPFQSGFLLFESQSTHQMFQQYLNTQKPLRISLLPAIRWAGMLILRSKFGFLGVWTPAKFSIWGFRYVEIILGPRDCMVSGRLLVVSCMHNFTCCTFRVSFRYMYRLFWGNEEIRDLFTEGVARGERTTYPRGAPKELTYIPNGRGWFERQLQRVAFVLRLFWNANLKR